LPLPVLALADADAARLAGCHAIARLADSAIQLVKASGAALPFRAASEVCAACQPLFSCFSIPLFPFQLAHEFQVAQDSDVFSPFRR